MRKNFWNTVIRSLRTTHTIQQQTSLHPTNLLKGTSEAQAMSYIHRTTVSDISVLYLVHCWMHAQISTVQEPQNFLIFREREQGQESKSILIQSLEAGAAPYPLCDLGEVLWPLRASFFPSRNSGQWMENMHLLEVLQELNDDICNWPYPMRGRGAAHYVVISSSYLC